MPLHTHNPFATGNFRNLDGLNNPVLGERRDDKPITKLVHCLVVGGHDGCRARSEDSAQPSAGDHQHLVLDRLLGWRVVLVE